MTSFQMSSWKNNVICLVCCEFRSLNARSETRIIFYTNFNHFLGTFWKRDVILSFSLCLSLHILNMQLCISYEKCVWVCDFNLKFLLHRILCICVCFECKVIWYTKKRRTKKRKLIIEAEFYFFIRKRDKKRREDEPSKNSLLLWSSIRLTLCLSLSLSTIRVTWKNC